MGLVFIVTRMGCQPTDKNWDVAVPPTMELHTVDCFLSYFHSFHVCGAWGGVEEGFRLCEALILICMQNFKLNFQFVWYNMVSSTSPYVFGRSKESYKYIKEYNSGGPRMLFLTLLASFGSSSEVWGKGWTQPPSSCFLQLGPSINLAEEEIRSEETGLRTLVWQVWGHELKSIDNIFLRIILLGSRVKQYIYIFL